MAATLIRGNQVADGGIQRVDLDVSTAGQAVIRKIIAGSGVTLVSTGVDAGTGDVTINASSSGGARTQVATAGEALSAGDWVSFYNASGTLYCQKASGSRASSTYGFAAHGYVLAAAAATSNATVYLDGVNTAVTGQTLGPVYLSATTPGAGTAVAPKAVQTVELQVGIALTATSVLFQPQPYDFHLPPPWYGYIYGAFGYGDPQELLNMAVNSGSVAATPTNIGTTVARLIYFTVPDDMIVNKIRFFGVGATTSVYRCAIYNTSGNRLTAELPFTTVAGAWGAAGTALNFALTAGTTYVMAVSVNATGTTAGLLCIGTTQTASTGQIAVAPNAYPGNLILIKPYAQAAVTAGALAATLSIAAQGAWTGGMPAFWLDNNNA